jgi:hypothetical protein
VFFCFNIKEAQAENRPIAIYQERAGKLQRLCHGTVIQ